MHFRKIKILILGIMVPIGIYLGYLQHKDKPLDYAQGIVDFTTKTVVLINYIPPTKEREESTKSENQNEESARR